MKLTSLLFVFSALFLAGCAHHYYYLPEIAGDGAISGHGGVVYSIPPKESVIKMKLVSLGIENAPKEAHAPPDSKMIQIRMYFLRTSGASVPVFVDPKEQTVTLTNGVELHPSLVHARTQKKPAVELSDAKKQAIEFFFPLANVANGASFIQFFSLRWRVHYGTTSEEQVVRFDREDSRPQQGAELFPGDPLYPYDESPEFIPDGWAVGEWGWWGMPLSL